MQLLLFVILEEFLLCFFIHFYLMLVIYFNMLVHYFTIVKMMFIVHWLANIKKYQIGYIIGGLLLRQKPFAHVTFFTFTWGMQDQVSAILQNLKLAHYVKIAPRSMLIMQLVATTTISTFIYSVTRYLLANIPGLCTNNSDWSCSYFKNFYQVFSRTGLIVEYQ